MVPLIARCFIAFLGPFGGRMRGLDAPFCRNARIERRERNQELGRTLDQGQEPRVTQRCGMVANRNEEAEENIESADDHEATRNAEQGAERAIERANRGTLYPF